jgi:hypothetical protein
MLSKFSTEIDNELEDGSIVAEGPSTIILP